MLTLNDVPAVNFSFTLTMDLPLSATEIRVPSVTVTGDDEPLSHFGFSSDTDCNVLTHEFTCDLDVAPVDPSQDAKCKDMIPSDFYLGNSAQYVNSIVALSNPPSFDSSQATYHGTIPLVITAGTNAPVAHPCATVTRNFTVSGADATSTSILYAYKAVLYVRACIGYYPISSVNNEYPIIAQACRNFPFQVTVPDKSFSTAVIVSTSNTPQPVLVQGASTVKCAGGITQKLRLVFDIYEMTPDLSSPIAFSFTFGGESYTQVSSATQVIMESDTCYADWQAVQAAYGQVGAADSFDVNMAMTVHFTQSGNLEVLEASTTQGVTIYRELFEDPAELFIPPTIISGSSVSREGVEPPLIVARTKNDLDLLSAGTTSASRVFVEEDAICTKVLLQNPDGSSLTPASYYYLELAMAKVCFAPATANLADITTVDPATGMAKGCRSSEVISSTEKLAVFDNAPYNVQENSNYFDVHLYGAMNTKVGTPSFPNPPYLSNYRTLDNSPGEVNVCDSVTVCILPKNPILSLSANAFDDKFMILDMIGSYRPFQTDVERNQCLDAGNPSFPDGRSTSALTKYRARSDKIKSLASTSVITLKTRSTETTTTAAPATTTTIAPAATATTTDPGVIVNVEVDDTEPVPVVVIIICAVFFGAMLFVIIVYECMRRRVNQLKPNQQAATPLMKGTPFSGFSGRRVVTSRRVLV